MAEIIKINDESLTRRTADADGVSTEGYDNHQWLVNWGEQDAAPFDLLVPPGRVFVLGDNRAQTVDSRNFGTVPMQDVVGRARQIWSSYSGSSGIRWERFGKVVR
ncbi:MAG: signal peptidase I [Candidatus Thiodiazotropha sp.]